MELFNKKLFNLGQMSWRALFCYRNRKIRAP